MVAYIARRFGNLCLTLFVVTMILFVLMHSVPGGPFELKFDKQPLPDYVLENIKHKYGLDKPLYEQYGLWLWALVHGDLGVPYESPTETVVSLIARAWPVTLRIGVLTLAVAYFFGLS